MKVIAKALHARLPHDFPVEFRFEIDIKELQENLDYLKEFSKIDKRH